MKPKDGIFVSRPLLRRAAYSFVVVPKSKKEDALEAAPPSSVAQYRKIIGTAAYFDHLLTVQYLREDQFTMTGSVISFANIIKVTGATPLEPDPDNAIKAVDEAAFVVKELPEPGPKLLARLSQLAMVAIRTPKKLLATQTVVKVPEVGLLLVPMMEMWAYLLLSPSLIKKAWILDSFGFAILDATNDDIPLDIFKKEVVDNLEANLKAFERDYMKAQDVIEEEMLAEEE